MDSVEWVRRSLRLLLFADWSVNSAFFCGLRVRKPGSCHLAFPANGCKVCVVAGDRIAVQDWRLRCKGVDVSALQCKASL